MTRELEQEIWEAFLKAAVIEASTTPLSTSHPYFRNHYTTFPMAFNKHGMPLSLSAKLSNTKTTTTNESFSSSLQQLR